MKYYWLPSKGGIQETWCIDERWIGYWFGAMDDPRVRDSLADKLDEFQDDVAAFARVRLFGSERLLSQGMTLEDVVAVLRHYGMDIRSIKLAWAHMESRIGHVERVLFLPEPYEDEDEE